MEKVWALDVRKANELVCARTGDCSGRTNAATAIVTAKTTLAIADGKKSPADWLLDGDVDVLITDVSDARLFARLENEPRIRRLFADYQGEDLRLFKETGIYAPAHAIIMSRRLDREHPELAGKLVAAFQEAKRLAEDDMLSDKAGFAVVYQRERLKEQQAAWGDPFAYGIRANRSTIDHFIRYNVEQGLIREPMSDKQIFAGSTLDS